MSKNTGETFPEYGSDYSFPSFEEKILQFWRDQKIFEQSVGASDDRPEYFFYDGPPFATGLPHYGHILAGAIKDIVPRYWTMKGYRVPRRFGWDTHGLPVEFEMEKTLGLQGSLDILDYGVAKFNEACRGIVLRYTGEWRKTVERMGRWVDMDHDYKTMDPDFMESVWWVFKELWDKGLIYEGKKVVPYSWRLTAPLSNFEASLNYKDVQDPAITVLMPLAPITGTASTGAAAGWAGNTALAIWTTTPWTLPSNLAVAVNPDPTKVTYVRAELPQAMGGITHVIMAEGPAEVYKLVGDDRPAPERVDNALLLGLHYEPLFESFRAEGTAMRAFRVIKSEHVSATDGTGLVHMAPAFGEDDFYACQAEGITLVDPTDMQASFTEVVARDERLRAVVGQFVKDGDKHIIGEIKKAGRLLKQDTLQHAYPFCERSDTPLIYKAISSWFVKVEAIKDRMLANNAQIHWVPEHIKDGRFGKWLENARDWCISRNRFWGTPIPVWRCDKCETFTVVGSRAELDALAGAHVEDLHKHVIDLIQPPCPRPSGPSGQPCGGQLQRTPEVLDCWFESGSMPYAQGHYPFENRQAFDKSFPADFIAEGLDQTRGWFYTLTVLSTALFDKPAFKNCIVNGIVQAEDGRKMSKRLKNYPDPNEIFNKYGADALRLYLMQSPAMHAEELRFSEKSLLELMRAVMIPLWNAYSFFASYANIDGLSPAQIAAAGAPHAKERESRSSLDHWIAARGKETLRLVHQNMEAYRLSEVAPALIDFIDDLTNWYIRLNRERFWKENDATSRADKLAAYGTLFECLRTLSSALAPFLPFLAETLHAALRGFGLEELARQDQSIHLSRWAPADELATSPQEEALLTQVRVAKQIIVLGRGLRAEAKIGVRQPLPRLRVAGLSTFEAQSIGALEDLICRELNVKTLELVGKASDLVEESAKPNHRVLGKKVGGAMKAVQQKLAQWTSQDIAAFEASGRATVEGFELDANDVQIARKAKAGRFAMAAHGRVAELDTALTPALVREGLQREIINRVQQRRKESKLHLADRIEIVWHATPNSLVAEVLQSESSSGQTSPGEASPGKASPGIIAAETLALRLTRAEHEDSALTSEDFGASGSLRFKIAKIASP